VVEGDLRKVHSTDSAEDRSGEIASTVVPVSDAGTYEFVDRDGVRLAYREYGDPAGEPVVLVHGLFAAGWSWEGFAPLLAEAGRRVIVPELRGHGHSDRTGPYTFEVFAGDLIFLLDTLGIDTVDLIGHSLGGHAASVVAQRQPQRIRRLVIEDAPPPPYPGDRYRGPGLRSLPPRSRVLLVAFLVARYRWIRRHLDLEMAKTVLREFRRPDTEWWSRLSEITAPTLLIHGGSDSHVPGYRLEEMDKLIPDCRLVTMPVGHRVHLSDPARFADLVLTFLAAEPVPGVTRQFPKSVYPWRDVPWGSACSGVR